jgi:hypothetical protein
MILLLKVKPKQSKNFMIGRKKYFEFLTATRTRCILSMILTLITSVVTFCYNQY